MAITKFRSVRVGGGDLYADGKMRIGDAQGATGVALSGVDPDQVFQVHGSISAAVAAGAYAGAYVTNTVTATQTNNVSIFGTWSELYVTGGTVSLASNHAAVWGNLEISGTVTMPGGIGWHGGVVGTVISPSTLTVSAGGILAGLVADSQVTAGHTATGAYVCGLAIRAGTSKPWPLGIYIEASAATTGIYIGKGTGRALQIGALSSAAATGMTFVASTGYEAVSVYTDDGKAALTGGDPFVGIHSRSMFFVDQAGSTTALGVFGQQKYASGVDIGPARTAAVEGYNEFMTTNEIKDGGLVGTLSSQTEISAGTLTIASGGILAGVHVRITGSGTATQSSGGILAGLYIDETVTSGTWGYGIYMPGSFVTNALYIRNTQATTALPTIDSQSIFSAVAGYHVGAQFYGDLTGVGTGSVYALRGHADNSAAQTPEQSIGQYVIGVQGRVINSGTYNSSGALIAGVLGQVLDGGTYTKVSMLSAIWADWQNAATVSSGTKNMIYITNNANQVVDNALYIKAGIGSGCISNFAHFVTCGVNNGMIRYQNVYTMHGGTYRNIRVLIDDVQYWIIVSDTPT
ncbi:MAG: hypothetical protein ABIH03_14145 [Pseudomonadota bacterium]